MPGLQKIIRPGGAPTCRLPLVRYDVASTGFGSCASTDVDGAACFGGMPRMATAIEAARQQAAAAGSDSLVLFAGDIYSGTSYDVVYTSQGDQIAPEFLAALGVQAMVRAGAGRACDELPLRSLRAHDCGR